MKKHIKKRFLHQFEHGSADFTTIEQSGIGISVSQMSQLKKMPEGSAAYLMTEDKKVFKAFSYKNARGDLKFIPEPDPILVYFNAAYGSYKIVKERKEQILDVLNKDIVTETMINELYDYFGAVSSFIILLFTSMEAVMNRCIKPDYNHIKKAKRCTESYSKSEIEKYFSYEDKLKDVLPIATGKNFVKNFPQKDTHLQNLKNYRDMIVHTKEASDGFTYDYIYKKAMTFKFDETINTVKDFCNYYLGDNFIQECDCDSQW